jgi:hypothetical protein
MSESIAAKFDNLDLNADAVTARPPELDATVNDLIARCSTLVEEVEAYVVAVDARQAGTKVHIPVEYRNLRSDFKSELAFLRKIAVSTMPPDKVRNYIVSSNLTYYEALWASAKRSSGLLGFRKNFFWNRHDGPPEKRTTKGLSRAKGGPGKGKTAALVDIVAEEGQSWVKVSTVSEKRLLFDLAKLGWVNDSDSDSECETNDTRPLSWEDEDDDDQVDVVKSARELARAARANPIRGHPPTVSFVLTRITLGKTKEVDGIIDKIKATGANVQCANDIPPPVPLDVVLPNLLIDRSRALSDTLNIDCTILLALISDISHKPCPSLDWYPKEVLEQIKEEANENLLPTHLYPAIASHSMVCTQEAADQMNLIVQTLATDEEKRRADLLVAQADCTSLSSEQILNEWVSMSNHAVPTGFKLPIRIVSYDIDAATRKLPAAAAKLRDEMSALNTSIFFYGWAEGLTTLSSNRARARQIEHCLNQHGLEDGQAGPHIWLCGESRSLIAKHGRRG